jgi:hypothetical protein
LGGTHRRFPELTARRSARSTSTGRRRPALPWGRRSPVGPEPGPRSRPQLSPARCMSSNCAASESLAIICRVAQNCLFCRPGAATALRRRPRSCGRLWRAARCGEWAEFPLHGPRASWQRSARAARMSRVRPEGGRPRSDQHLTSKRIVAVPSRTLSLRARPRAAQPGARLPDGYLAARSSRQVLRRDRDKTGTA